MNRGVVILVNVNENGNENVFVDNMDEMTKLLAYPIGLAVHVNPDGNVLHALSVLMINYAGNLTTI